MKTSDIPQFARYFRKKSWFDKKVDTFAKWWLKLNCHHDWLQALAFLDKNDRHYAYLYICWDCGSKKTVNL